MGGVRGRLRLIKKFWNEKLVIPCRRAIAAATRRPTATPNHRRARSFSPPVGALPRVRKRACVSNHGRPSPSKHTNMIVLHPRTRNTHADSRRTALRHTQFAKPRRRTSGSSLSRKAPCPSGATHVQLSLGQVRTKSQLQNWRYEFCRFSCWGAGRTGLAAERASHTKFYKTP